jgi:hypothetical protein
MKARQVLAFIFGVFLLLGAAWAVFPAEGVRVGGRHLRFASYRGYVRDAMERKVDVDSVLNALDGRFAMHEDTLAFYRDFFYENPDRIYLPDDDYTFFDPVFRAFERAGKEGKTLRVAHYGDSQIEMDRISQNLREALQTRFGGLGTGMFPALTTTPMATVSHFASGGFAFYTMIVDSTTRRAGHNRYGPLAQVSNLYGSGTVTLRARKEKSTLEHVKTFQSVSVLYARASDDFSVAVQSDTLNPRPLSRSKGGVTWTTWTFSRPVDKATVKMTGNAEIYGLTTDGAAGVAVDNIPMRGSTGHVLSRIDKDLMKSAFELDGTALVILQFGGNFVPASSTTKAISGHMDKVRELIAYYREVAPGAKILFIGPSDMASSTEDGRIVSYRRLPELVDSLKAVSLRSGVAYWDLYRMMGGQNSMSQWVRHRPAYAGPDYVHFTPAGAKVVGETLSRSLLTYYDFYDLRKTLPAAAVQQRMER